MGLSRSGSDAICQREIRKEHQELAGHGIGLRGKRHRFGGIRPQGTRHRRDGDAGPDGAARGVRRIAAAQGRADRGVAPHDDPDGGADRDADGARRGGPLGLVQHLFHPGPRGRRDRGIRRAGLRDQGRDPRGILGLHRPHLRFRGRREHDPRRWRRRHDVHPDRRARRGGRDRPDRDPRPRRRRSTSSPRSRSASRNRRAGSSNSATPSRASRKRPPPACTASIS